MMASDVARGVGTVWRLFVVLLYAACAIAALWPGLVEFNPAIRGGIAALFAGRAVADVLLFAVRRQSGAAKGDRIVRSYLVLSYAHVTAGILVGAGALWYGGMKGFLVAYAAFSFAWVWWWIRRTLSKVREEEQSI
jgi:hypothetical protein